MKKRNWAGLVKTERLLQSVLDLLSRAPRLPRVLRGSARPPSCDGSGRTGNKV